MVCPVIGTQRIGGCNAFGADNQCRNTGQGIGIKGRADMVHHLMFVFVFVLVILVVMFRCFVMIMIFMFVMMFFCGTAMVVIFVFIMAGWQGMDIPDLLDGNDDRTIPRGSGGLHLADDL